MKITLIGHAGFLVETTSGGILVDPWLRGPAFGDTWDLLEPSFMPPDLWDRVRWIWFSHEHPDHFHLPSLRLIPAIKRDRILTLFQKTRDKRVVQWLKTNGFSVREIENDALLTLGTSTRFRLGCVGVYDSWCMIEDAGAALLNLNDCAINSDGLKRISEYVQDLDVLITQFSYAAWPGNPDDTSAQILTAQSQLWKLRDQTKILSPKAVIPAASFVVFSHTENSWMNANRVEISKAVEGIQEARSTPVALVPGDTWVVSSPWNNDAAIQHYKSIWDLGDRPLHQSESATIDEIVNLANAFAIRLRASNNRLLLWVLDRTLGLLRPITFRVVDHKKIIRVDPRRGAQILNDQAPDMGIVPRAVEFC